MIVAQAPVRQILMPTDVRCRASFFDDVTNVVDSNNTSNSKVSVLTPEAGTMVKFVCDGQKWYINGHVVSATNTAIVFADQS